MIHLPSRLLSFRVLFLPALLAVLCTSSTGGEHLDSDARLRQALDAIQAEDISADLHFFAGEELGGRDTPSVGLRIAARFIRTRLERLGIAPGAEGGYFYTYPLLHNRLIADGSRLSFELDGERHDLAFGEDYFFRTWRALFRSSTQAGTVFCGDGSRESFEQVEIEGRWALCFFAEGVSRTQRRRLAERGGAAGLLVLPAPASGEDPYPERHGRLAEAMLEGNVSNPTERTLEKLDESGFPELLLSRKAGLLLLEACAARAEQDPAQWVPELGSDLGLTLSEERSAKELVEAENVAGFWKGSDPELSKEVVLLSAHYDHEGTRRGVVYPGADDNGSGSVGMLAVAEALVRYGPMRRSVMFLWVSGEEKGLWGSKAWAADPWLPPGTRAVCNLNMDMIGRNAPGELYLTPTREHREHNVLTTLIGDLAPVEGFTSLGSADSYWHRSDHASFHDKLDIPVAFLFTGTHEDYTRPTDTPDKIDYDKLRRVCRLVVRLLDRLQEDELGG